MKTIWKMTTLIACPDGAGNVTHVFREFYVDTAKSLDVLLDQVTQHEHGFKVASVAIQVEPYNSILAEIDQTQVTWRAK